jgi:hypothetical protein
MRLSISLRILNSTELIGEQNSRITLEELSNMSIKHAYGINEKSQKSITAPINPFFLNIVNIPDKIKTEILQQIRLFLRAELDKQD